MTDVNPIESDSMRELRRIGPIAQALFTLAFAVAACTLALVLMGSTAIPAPTGQTAVLQPLATVPAITRGEVSVPSSIISASIQPETLPPAF